MTSGAFSARTRAAIYARDGDRCAGCGAAGPLTVQHRMARGSGGRAGVDSPANGLTLCGSGTTGCHGWAEAHPVEAETIGWRVPSWGDPAAVPVLVRFYGVLRWEFLDADGQSFFYDHPDGEPSAALLPRLA